MFSNTSIASMLICSLLCIIIPIVAMIIYKIKNKDVRISSFFIGGAVFFLFALVLEQIMHYFMLPVVSGSTVAYVFYGAFAAGIFEETGRFVTFKTVMKQRNDPKEAVMYGLGHGGTEAILLAGLSMLGSAVTAIMTNQMGLDAMISLSSGGNAETAEALRTQLETLAAVGTGTMLLSVLERIIAMTFHTAMSVIVFESARGNGKGLLFPACILFHAALDIPAVLYQREVIPLYALYPIITVITAAAVWFAVKSYKRTKAVCTEEETA